jgi:trans-2,3-dihydro-3-hydroxyanthranilate isomerase
MFAPAMGISEDPATGAAAAALAGYLCDSALTPASRAIEIEQGIELQRPSLIHATFDPATRAVRLKGEAVVIGTGTLAIPQAF